MGTAAPSVNGKFPGETDLAICRRCLLTPALALRGYSMLDEIWELPSLIFAENFNQACWEDRIQGKGSREHSASKHLLTAFLLGC